MPGDARRGKGGCRRHKLLLHVCCAPCSTAVIERLQPDYDVVLFWYNPNITDPAEHEQRLQEMRKYAEHVGAEFIVGSYDVGAWRQAIAGLEKEPEGGRRCEACFRLRLQAAAQMTVQRDIGLFTTTLTVSPHKSYEKVRAAGLEASRAAGPKFLALDFKKKGGFQRSAQLAVEHGMYRQNYCGCEFSKRHRDARRAGRASGR